MRGSSLAKKKKATEIVRHGPRSEQELEKRVERADLVIRGAPQEVAASMQAMRRLRYQLEGLFNTAAESGEVERACRVSDSIVKIASQFQSIAKDNGMTENNPKKVFDMNGKELSSLLNAEIVESVPPPDTSAPGHAAGESLTSRSP